MRPEEISVVANAIAYVVERGTPPQVIEIPDERVELYVQAATRAIETLDTFRSDQTMNHTFNPEG